MAIDTQYFTSYISMPMDEIIIGKVKCTGIACGPNCNLHGLISRINGNGFFVGDASEALRKIGYMSHYTNRPCSTLLKLNNDFVSRKIKLRVDQSIDTIIDPPLKEKKTLVTKWSDTSLPLCDLKKKNRKLNLVIGD